MSGFSGLCGVFGAVFDLRERGRYGFICGLYGVCSVLILCQLLGWAFQIKTQSCSFGFYITGREYQERQAEEGGDATCGEQVGLRIKRRGFRRFCGHR
ncbi:hypothetical protein EMIT048CA2_200003 [Pseudomonas chlororaphis]